MLATQMALAETMITTAEFALNWLLQSTLLLTIGLTLGRLLRRRGSAVQSVVYRTTIVTVLICPFVTWGLSQAGVSGWSIELPRNESQPTAAKADLAVAADKVLAISSESTDRPAFDGNDRIAGNLPVSDPFTSEARTSQTIATPMVVTGVLAEKQKPASSPSRLGPVVLIALACWFLVTLTLSTRLAFAWRQLAALRKRSTSADAATTQACQELASTLEVSPPEVLRSPCLPSPCLAGLRRPAVLLPEDDTSLSIREVLVHELAHLKRRDCQWNLLRQVATALFPFQPLLWILSRRIETTAEEVCDDYVVHYGGDRRAYAHRLVDIAELSVAPIAAAGVGMVSFRSMLAQRVARIMDTSRTLSTRVGNLLLAAVLLGGLVGTTLTGLVGLAPQDLRAEVETSANESPSAKDQEIINSSLSGHILDDLGNPVTDATIELTGVRTSNGRYLNHYESKTDEEGLYIFKEVREADNYRVRITSQKWVGLTNWRKLPRIQLSPDNKAVRDFRMARACSLRIRTVDEAGNPVKNVSIFAASLAKERWSNSESVRTDKQGWTTIGGLKPSEIEYAFGTMHKEFAFAKLVRKLDDPVAQPEAVIVLHKGVDVSGTVLCSDGKPAAGWRINAMPDWWNFGASPTGATIAEDGSFAIPHVTQDKYDVTVSVPTGEGMSLQEPAISDIALPPANGHLEVRLRLPSPQTMTAISGRATMLGGPSHETISVYARSENNERSGSGSIRPGEPTFRISPLPPGRYTLTFSSTEIEQKKVLNVLSPSDDLEVELQVTGKPRLMGTVVRADTGKPLTRFRIRIRKVGYLRGPGYVQDTRWQTIENTEGKFAVDVVEPGIYQIIAMADDLAPVLSERINTDEQQGKPIRLEMKSGVTLTGTVVDEAGQPVSGAIVTPFSRSTGAIPRNTQKFTGEEGAVKTVQGRFVLTNLSAGKEFLKVTYPDHCFAISQVYDVGEEDIEAQPIVLTSGGTVSGRVVDADGQPEADVTLYFQSDIGYGGSGDDEKAGRFATVVTDQEGFYEARSLPEQLCYVRRADDTGSELGVVWSAILPVNGQQHRLDLGKTNQVTGRLLISGKPLRNTRVQLGGEHPTFGIFKAIARTDEEGAFTFWGPEHGLRTLYYGDPERRHGWIQAKEILITKSTNDLGDLDFRSTDLTVSVTGLAEEESSQLRLSLTAYDPIWTFRRSVRALEARQGPSDPFVFRRVPPGPYELVCQRMDGLALRKRIEIKAGDRTRETRMEWPSTAGRLSVHMDESLFDPNVHNPPNLWSVDQRISAELFSREGNEIRFKNIPAGKYYLTDRDTREAPHAMDFSVKADETNDLRLTADSYTPQPFSAGMLVVRCYTEEGIPLTGCKVTLTSPEKIARRNSAQRGRQTFVGDPGEYTMAVTFPGYKTVHRKVTLHKVGPDGMAIGNVEIDVRLSQE